MTAATRPIERVNEVLFWAKVEQNGPVPEAQPELGPCWIWGAACDAKGYGRFGVDGKILLAHRVSYTINVGPIPADLQLDHLCRRHECVNPAHLEPVTQQANIARGEAGKRTGARQRSKTHCPQGHLYDGDNLYVIERRGYTERGCRTCRRAASRRHTTKKRK